MGSPVSAILANLVMEHVEEKALTDMERLQVNKTHCLHVWLFGVLEVPWKVAQLQDVSQGCE